MLLKGDLLIVGFTKAKEAWPTLLNTAVLLSSLETKLWFSHDSGRRCHVVTHVVRPSVEWTATYAPGREHVSVI